MRIQQRWATFGRRHPKALAFLQGLWMVLEALMAAVIAFFAGFGSSYAENYAKNRFGVIMASLFLLLVLGVLLWHPWNQHKPAVKPGTTVQEPQEPQGLGKLLPRGPKLSFSEAERRAIVAQYGQNALLGQLLVVSPGHGGRDAVTSYGLDVGCSWVFDGEAYWEAAYTYRMARELGLMAEALGATVVYAAEAESMDQVTGPKDPLPLPKEAVLYGGNPMQNSSDTVDRAKAAAQAQSDHQNCTTSAFVELHVDSLGSNGWSGLRECHRRGNTGQLAGLIENVLLDQGYGRKRFGKPVNCTLAKTFDVLGGYNTIENKVLLECGVPNSDAEIAAQAKDPRWKGLSAAEQRRFLGGDSWRLRNPENRRIMLQKVVIGPLVELNKGSGR